MSDNDVDQAGRPFGSRGLVDVRAVVKGLAATVVAVPFLGGWAPAVGLAAVAYEKRRHRQGHE
jgi:hypothetical protein